MSSIHVGAGVAVALMDYSLSSSESRRQRLEEMLSISPTRKLEYYVAASLGTLRRSNRDIDESDY